MFKRLVGSRVLNITLSHGQKRLRLFAHCTSETRLVTEFVDMMGSDIIFYCHFLSFIYSGYARGSVVVYGINVNSHNTKVFLPANFTLHQYLLSPANHSVTDRSVCNGENTLQ